MPNALHDADYVAAALGKPTNWVRRNAYRFPHVRLGRSYKFSDDDIAAIIDMHRVQPNGKTAAKRDPMRPVSRRRAS